MSSSGAFTPSQQALDMRDYLQRQDVADPFGEFTKKYRSALYGRSMTADNHTVANPYKYRGQSISSYDNADPRLWQTQETKKNADYAMGVVDKFFGGVPQRQRDEAAAKLIDYDHMRNVWGFKTNPNDIVRKIGASLGGLTPQQEAQLAQSDGQWNERIHQMTSRQNANNKAASDPTVPLAILAGAAMFGGGLLGAGAGEGAAAGATEGAAGIGGSAYTGGLEAVNGLDIGGGLGMNAAGEIGSGAGFTGGTAVTESLGSGIHFGGGNSSGFSGNLHPNLANAVQERDLLSLPNMGGGTGATGTIEGMGTLTNTGELLPAAGGAAGEYGNGESLIDKLKRKAKDKLSDELLQKGLGLLGNQGAETMGAQAQASPYQQQQIKARPLGLLQFAPQKMTNLFDVPETPIYDYRKG